MSRLDLLTVVIVAVCLAALGFLLYKTFQLMNPPEPEIAVVDEPQPDEYNFDSDTTYQDYYGDDYEPVPGSPLDPSADTDSSLAVDEPDTEFTEPAPATTTRPAPSRQNTTTTAPATGGSAAATRTSAGDFMVIAGSFRQMANAERRVRQLKKMGYNEAEVSRFNSGAFAVALVDRFNSESDARALVGELRGKGVEAFIKKQE